jgi:hypothetical protein
MIPLPRKASEGMRGLDVRAYKRALRKAQVKPELGPKSRFGPQMTRAVKHFQHERGLRQTGSIGNATYPALYLHIDLFGRSLLRAYRLRHRTPTTPPESEVRQKMLAEMKWGIAHEPQIHYPPGDVRKEPNTVPLNQWKRHRLPITLDCSEAATAVAYRAGAPDPNGDTFGKTGLLYTGTMLAHCKKIRQRDLAVGDYVVYGPSTGDHVSVVYETGSDPLLWSHGFEGGPLLIRLSAQRTMHRSPVTFLSAGI